MSGPMSNTAWDEVHVEKLRALVAAGKSGGQIVREFRGRYTRNAIVGKASRLGLQLKGGAGSAAKTVCRTQGRRSATSSASPFYSGNPKTSPLQKSLDVIAANQAARRTYVDAPDGAGSVALADLAGHHCRWPIGDPSSDAFRFCGHGQRAGSQYCEPHHRRAYVKPPAPKDYARSLRRFVA